MRYAYRLFSIGKGCLTGRHPLLFDRSSEEQILDAREETEHEGALDHGFLTDHTQDGGQDDRDEDDGDGTAEDTDHQAQKLIHSLDGGELGKAGDNEDPAFPLPRSPLTAPAMLRCWLHRSSRWKMLLWLLSWMPSVPLMLPRCCRRMQPSLQICK